MTSAPSLPDRLLAGYFREGLRGFRTLMKLAGKNSLQARTRYGARFALRPDEYIDAIVLREGYYEPEVIEALRPYLRPEAVFWDIGANLGLHAVSAAQLATGARVLAFEPAPATFARLQAHVRLNHVDVDLHPFALGERDGEVTLHVNTSGNAGMSSIVHPGAGTGTSVRLVRADTAIATGLCPAPTVMKLDVEGAEAAVLAGFGRRLASPALEAVVYETSADLLDEPSRCPATRLLLAAGFQLRALPRAASSTHLLANFLAFRR